MFGNYDLLTLYKTLEKKPQKTKIVYMQAKKYFGLFLKNQNFSEKSASFKQTTNKPIMRKTIFTHSSK